MEHDDATPDAEGGVDLFDGTWVDVGTGPRWSPSSGERTRAAVVLVIVVLVLACLALFASLGDRPPRPVAVTTTSTTESTTTTTEALDPSSLDGEPASQRCRSDDRGALPLRDRQDSTVLVLNGTSRNGHAGATTSLLERLGYSSAAPDNHDLVDVTRVLYRTGFCAEAERAAEDLGQPGAIVESVVEDDLPVVVGRARLVVIAGKDSL